MDGLKRGRAKTAVIYTLSALVLLTAVANLLGLISLKIVQTTSMQGTINEGDLVVSQNWLKPKVGDIAIYREEDFQGNQTQEVVHRVIAGDQFNGYTFQGDNNQSADALPVDAKQVRGVVAFWIPGVKNLANPFIQILLASLLLFITFSRGYFKKWRGQLKTFITKRKPLIRVLLRTFIALFTTWILVSALSLFGWAKFEHPQAGPSLPLENSTNALVMVLPHANAGVGDLAMADIAGKRHLVRVERIEGPTITISSSIGRLLVTRRDIEGPIRFVVPFIGSLWLPFNQ